MYELTILLSSSFILLHCASNAVELPDFPYVQKEHYLVLVTEDLNAIRSHPYFKLLTTKGDE